MQMGVVTDKHKEGFQATTAPVTWATPPAGAVEGSPKYAFALDPRVNDSATAVNSLLASGQTVRRATAAVKTRTGELPAGAFLVDPSAAGPVTQLASRLGLKVAAVDAKPAKVAGLKAPRIGLYKAVGGNADEGWTRYILERFGFGYTSMLDAEIRKGDLRSKYDVIVLPDASYAAMRDGKKAGSYPEELTGGMTDAGVGNLKTFVEDGGTLVTLNDASELPIKGFKLPITDVTEGVSSSDYYVPGSILKTTTDNTDPLAYGLPEEISAFASSSPAFTVNGDGVRTVAKYPGSGLLKSGWLLGEGVIAGRANVLDAKVGKGDVAILGFKPQHRAQSHGTYKLLFNALYLSTTS
jgi:hypothetical protein